MGSKRLFFFIFVLGILFFHGTSVFAGTYYVSNAGNDSSVGSQLSPFKTISKAMSSSSIGDTLIVKSGSYPAFSFDNRIIECNLARTCITTGSVNTIKLKNNATLRGFVVDGGTVSAGIELYGNSLAENNEVKNRGRCLAGSPESSTICPHYSDTDGFRFFGSNNTMRGNYIHDNSYYNPLNFTDNAEYAPHIDCFQTYFGANNNTIEFNICDNFSTSKWQGTQGVMLQDATNTIIRNNYFHTYHAKVNIRESDQVSIYNNIFVGGPVGQSPQQYGVFNGNGTNVTVKNNLFYNINGGSTSLIYNVPTGNIVENIPINAAGSRSSLNYIDPKLDTNWHPLPGSPVCTVGLNGTYVGAFPCSSSVSLTSTPVPNSIPSPTSTPAPTPSLNILSCICNTNNTCSTSCSFSKFTGETYASTIKCSQDQNILSSVPTLSQKNNWCKSNLRTKGDTDGNGVFNSLDYLYYVSAVNGGKIPPTVNLDVDGDGIISTLDRGIILKYQTGN